MTTHEYLSTSRALGHRRDEEGVPDRRRGGVDALSNLGEVQHHRDHALSGRKDALVHRHVRPITRIIGRVGRLRGGYALPTLGRSGKLSWCSNGLTGAEVQVRLAMGVRGEFLETDPRGELLDRAELAVCLDIIGAPWSSAPTSGLV